MSDPTASQPPSSTLDPTSNAVTEAEAALYDRQIRLWGLEAQNRMRTSHVLVYGLTGVSTEIIKNIVLSGIGTLSILDDGEVREEELAAGFFWREEDVGASKVAEGPLARIQALNPLVKVQGLTDASLLFGPQQSVPTQIKTMALDVVVACRGSRSQLVQLNATLRQTHTKFYATAALGFGGYIFSDLGPAHDYITERTVPLPSGPSVPAEAKKKTKNRYAFVPLGESLRADWHGWDERKVRRLRLSPGLWSVWAWWDVADRTERQDDAVRTRVDELLAEKGVASHSVFGPLPADKDAWFRSFDEAVAVEGEFAPTCAVLGGLLAQDLLNALGGREEPIVNWLVLDGLGSGNASVHAVGEGIRGESGIGA